MDRTLVFCVLVVICYKISPTVQDTHTKENIDTLLERLIEGVNNASVDSIKSNPNNNSRVIYFKTVPEPSIIFKRKSNDTEDENKNPPTPDFLYDDLEEEQSEQPNSTPLIKDKSSENVTRRSQENSEDTTVEKPESRDAIKDLLANRNKGKITPDFIIDQFVYEESETNFESFRSELEDLKKEVANHNNKDKYRFTRLFSDIKNLYNEIEALKIAQEKIITTQDMLSRRVNVPDMEMGRTTNLQPRPNCPYFKNGISVQPNLPNYEGRRFINAPPMQYRSLNSIPQFSNMRQIPHFQSAILKNPRRLPHKQIIYFH
ncbi:unnamed protein product [Leptosia nina]|uniref:Uncharacterized protein n=1 Tax=Leptosia nina TaxID=320188 RepID=A0AAV1J3D7_9NEOP